MTHTPDLEARLRAEKQWDYSGSETANHARRDIEYAYGLEACLDEGQYDGAGNVRDLIGMVKWNALGLIEAPDELARRAERIAALYEALVQADLKIRSFPHTDQSDVEFIRTALGETT